MQLQVFRRRSSSNSKCPKAIRRRPGLPKRRLTMRKRKSLFQGPAAEVPELMKIATRKEARPPELDTFAAAFAVAGENQEKVADEQTLVLLKRFSRNPDVEKAQVEFERAQKVQERFHKDFDGVDFTER
jgi:hypothetical protein